MHSIVCFGDSNTWGKKPGSQERWPFHLRWPGVLQALVGNAARVHEEGLNGRTTVWDDPMRPDRSGRSHLGIVLESHAPVDVLVILLGTNDLKQRFSLSPFAIAEGVGSLLELCEQHQQCPKQVIVVSPPLLTATPDEWNTHAFENGISRSALLAEHYEFFARRFSARFIDGGALATADKTDGIHIDAHSHRRIGEAVAREINAILGSKPLNDLGRSPEVASASECA